MSRALAGALGNWWLLRWWDPLRREQSHGHRAGSTRHRNGYGRVGDAPPQSGSDRSVPRPVWWWLESTGSSDPVPGSRHRDDLAENRSLFFQLRLKIGHRLGIRARTIHLFAALITQAALVQQRAILHVIPDFDHSSQITDRSKLAPADADIRAHHLIGTIGVQALLQICPLLPAQFERILPLPVRLQPLQARLLIRLRPLADTAFIATHRRLDHPPLGAAPVQARRLQPVEIVSLPYPNSTSGIFFFIYPSVSRR